MADRIDILALAEEFEWDEGNVKKNWEKHRVAHIECEEIFFNKPVIMTRNGTRNGVRLDY